MSGITNEISRANPKLQVFTSENRENHIGFHRKRLIHETAEGLLISKNNR